MKMYKRISLRGLKVATIVSVMLSVLVGTGFFSSTVMATSTSSKAPATISTASYVSAAINRKCTRAFSVHASGSYAFVGCASITQTNNDGTRGYITLTSNCTFTKNGRRITLPCGTRWNFTVSSFREGGKINLTIDKYASGASVVNICNSNGLSSMTGKIHTETDTQCLFNFWKIDSLGSGFYFKNR